MEDCQQITSDHGSGIWLRGAARSRISNTRVKDCAHTGIYLDSAPSFLQGVKVTNYKDSGITCDWPTSAKLKDDEYFFLSKQGHSFTNVFVEECQNNGLHVFPGVRVVVHNSTFKNNEEEGVYFQGPEDESLQKKQVFQERAAKCAQSIIENCDISGNQGFGVFSETTNAVQLLGPNDKITSNGKGNVEGISTPSKRARTESTKSESSDEESIDQKLPARVTPTSTTRFGETATDGGRAQNREETEQAMIASSIPVAAVTAKAGVRVPENWPPGLIFIGDANVSGWPAIHTLQDWYFTRPARVNKLVRIAPLAKDRGMGCFAATNLRKGKCVGFYSGHLRRQQTMHDSEYVAKWHPTEGARDDEWEIDAEWGGNEMRFANYPDEDEEPNMFADCRPDKNCRQVIVFEMLENVKKGTELLWDYGPDYLEEKKEE